MFVYLSGQILDWEEANLWRNSIQEIAGEYGLSVLNPIESQDSHESGYRELIYARNMKLLEKADLVLVRWEDKKNSVGTVVEICKAKEKGVPVVVLASSPKLAAQLDEDPYMMHLHTMQSVLFFSQDNVRDVFEWFDTLPHEAFVKGGYGPNWTPQFIA